MLKIFDDESGRMFPKNRQDQLSLRHDRLVAVKKKLENLKIPPKKIAAILELAAELARA